MMYNTAETVFENGNYMANSHQACIPEAIPETTPSDKFTLLINDSDLHKAGRIKQLWDFSLSRSTEVAPLIKLLDLLPDSSDKKKRVITHSSLHAFLECIIRRISPENLSSDLCIYENEDNIIIELSDMHSELTSSEIEGVFSTMLALGSLFIKNYIIPMKMQFKHSEPDNVVSYYQTFGCPVSFNNDSDRLILSKSLLKVFGVVYHTVSFQVSRVIEEQLGETTPPRHEVALKLNTSERTLQRRLDEEGTSYKELLDDVRRERAIQILKDTPHLNLPHVASKVGFTDAATLTRAFKRWTGMTPGNWRRQYS